MNKISWFMITLLIFALFLIPAATADNYVGGIPLRKVADGIVSGGLYYDGWYGMGTTVQKSFTIPDHTEVKWARLYVVVYCGNMRENYQVAMDVRFDGDGDGTYERTWSEHMNSEYSWPGDGGSGPVDLGNGNRVTSDYVYWYDVTRDIRGTKVNTEVKTSRPSGYIGTFDGRIKLVTLIVAYDDGTSDQIYYQVNQGHDVSSYYDESYVGQTDFDLPSIEDDPVSASLSVIHLASRDGRYWINREQFQGRTPQGAYSGWNQWNVLDVISGAYSCTLEYQKAADASSYKIPLAMLTVSYPEERPKMGEIEVESNPPGASIFLDGVDSGRKTPMTLRNILIGSHTIMVKLDGYQEASKTVNVIEDDVVTLHFEMKKVSPADEEGQKPGVGNGTTDPVPIAAPPGSPLGTVVGSGYHGGSLSLYRTGTLNGRVHISTAGTYTGLIEAGKGTENTHSVEVGDNATAIDARLYVYTTWSHNERSREGVIPDVRVMMDESLLPLSAIYSDRKGFGAFDYFVNTFAFDASGAIQSSGNYSFQIVNQGGSDETFACYGSSLIFVTEDPSAPAIHYWITEGSDAILADPAFETTSEEATTTALFTGVIDPAMLRRATLSVIATAASGISGDQNRVIFNEMDWINQLKGGSSQISVVHLPVVSHLIKEGNSVMIQSYAAPGMKGDYIEVRNAILVLQLLQEGEDSLFIDDLTPEFTQEGGASGADTAYAGFDGLIAAQRLRLIESGVTLIIGEGSRITRQDGSFSPEITLRPAPTASGNPDIIPIFLIEPEGETIDIPIISMVPGSRESTLFWYNRNEDQWEPVLTRYDTGSSMVTSRITRLGMYGISDRYTDPTVGDREEKDTVLGMIGIYLADLLAALTSPFQHLQAIYTIVFPGLDRGSGVLYSENGGSEYETILPQVITLDQSDMRYSLTIRSNPPGALISLDGNYIGRVTPYTITDLPAGSHTISLSMDGFHPVSEEIDLVMEMTVTYDLSASMRAREVLKVEDPDLYTSSLGGIYITSFPNEAEIYLDGRRTSRITPRVFYGLAPGSHTIRVQSLRDTFPVDTKEVWVEAGEITPVHFSTSDEIYLRPVTIDSEAHTGLPFSVNGIFQPKTIPAEVMVRGSKAPYITVYDGSHFLSLRIGERPSEWPKFGYIFVDSSPAGAAINLDGFSTGLYTPATIYNVSEGPHRLTVSIPGHLPGEETFWLTSSIHEEVSETFHFNLPRYAFGTLRIESTPPGARIYLNGQNTGLMTPQVLPYMDIGSHSIRLARTGVSKTLDAIVHPNQVTDVTVRL